MKSLAEIVMDELELRNLATVDQLTEAVTRRAFLEEAAHAVGRLNRYRYQASIIMFDLDHFKQINDRYGHSAGDAVLRAVGAACNGLIRDCDSFGRLGGEEFAILLPDTAQSALAAAERYRETIATLAIPGYPDLSVTASLGVASLMPDISKEEWLSMADTAMYAAKRCGRNQCRLTVLE